MKLYPCIKQSLLTLEQFKELNLISKRPLIPFNNPMYLICWGYYEDSLLDITSYFVFQFSYPDGEYWCNSYEEFLEEIQLLKLRSIT